MKSLGLLALALACALAVGCKKTPPPVTEVEGRVTLNGQPLPHASVQFMPELSDFGAEMNSSGVTDEKGQFRLTCLYKNQSGAVVATHRVLVTEAPPGEGMRGSDQASQERLMRYQASLKNRPIPEKYGNYTQTPMRVEVKADQKVYEVALSR